MLQTINRTVFKTHVSLFTDQHGSDAAVTVIKGTFKIPADPTGPPQLAAEQIPVFTGDEYFGEPGKSGIKYPCDSILGKKTTDIGFVGHAYSNDKAPVTHLQARIAVGHVEKTIQVTGDRTWKKRRLLPGFSPTPPEPFTKMPIVYERAFGGIDDSHNDAARHAYCKENPVGTGFCTNKAHVANRVLPNLEHPDHLITHWQDKPPVMGLGFVDSSWEPRLQYAGTYDEEWENNQAPLLPMDFKIDFFNAAASGLQSPRFMQGGEPVELTHLSPNGSLEFTLPKIEINTRFQYGDTDHLKKAELWTVFFEPDEDRFCMVWGQSFPAGKQLSKMHSVTVDIEGESPFSHQDDNAERDES